MAHAGTVVVALAHMSGWIPNDTTPEVWAAQRAVYQRLGGGGRIEIMFRLNETVRRLTISGIRARHPAYNDAQVQRAYARLVLGDALAAAVWPFDDLVDP
jgi:hypothetical protein